MKLKHNEEARVWKAPGADGVLLFRAQFQRFSYTKHTHSEFAIGIVEDGSPTCFHKGGLHIVPAGSIITLNPDEIHTGEPTTNKSYNYRMAYIPLEVVEELLHAVYGREGLVAYFRNIVTFDTMLSQRLLFAFQLLEQQSSNLLQTQIAFFQAITDLFYRHGQPNFPPRRIPSHPAGMRKACDFIHAMAPNDISLDDMAEIVGMSRFHFLRLFRAETGFSPYAYLIQRRVEIAKELIRDGHSLAQAALEAGFADQSHMTRRFKVTYGVTPGQYRQALARK